MVKLISTFFLIGFFIGSYNEAIDMHVEFSQESITTSSEISQSDCDDCEDDCQNEERCCQLICHAGVAILVSPKFISKSKQVEISKSINWYYFSGYLPPNLEQDIKPPFFS